MMQAVLWFNIIVVPLAAIVFLAWVVWMLRDRWSPLRGQGPKDSPPSNAADDEQAG